MPGIWRRQTADEGSPFELRPPWAGSQHLNFVSLELRDENRTTRRLRPCRRSSDGFDKLLTHALWVRDSTLTGRERGASTDGGEDTHSTPARPLFVGRERELSELRNGLADATSGRGRLGGVFLISGEPGIGKTRLADELAADAASRGMRVVWGRCWEGGGAPAYWPWVEVLRSLILDERRDREPHSALPPEIARLIPELSAETVPSRVQSDPEQARFRLFDAVATLLRQLARSRPLVLILDDLHEADRSSLELLKFIARQLRDSRIVVVGTHRDAEVRRSPYLAETISEIVRHGRTLPLAGFDEDEVRQIIEHHTHRPLSTAFASELYRVTAGNPLFVDGIIRVLAAEHKLETSERLELKGFNLPEGVRGAIRKRLALLSAEARSVLTIAAVIGQEFDPALLQRVSQLNAEPLAELTRETSEVGVVTAASREGYRFTHPLIRESLYKGSTDAERMRLHRAIGEALEQMHAANLTPHLAELAHHFRKARIVEKAIDYSIRAGDEARRIFAHEDAVSHWSTAIELVEESGGEQRLHADLHLRLGELIGGQGQGAKATEHLEKALRAYEELGDVRRATEIHLSLGINLSLPGLARVQDLPRAADHLRRAEAVLSKGPEDFSLGRLYFGIGWAENRTRRVRDAETAFRHSMEIAERIGDPALWALSAGNLAMVMPQTGQIGEALEVQAQVWSKLDALTVPGTPFGAVSAAGLCLMQLWDPRGAQKWWGTELAKSRLGRGQRKVFIRLLQDAYLLSGDSPAARSLLEQEPHASAAGMLAFYEGDWDRADSILEQGLERARSGLPSEMLLYGQALARVRWNRGETTSAETLLREVLALYPEEEPNCQVEMVVRPELALVYLEMGRLEDAVAEVHRCREVSAGEDWRGLGGHLARADAAVAAGEGKLDAALAGFESAVTIFRKYALPWEEADTLHRWGRALLAAGAPDRANQKFDAAIQLYQCHGAGRRWIDRVETARKSGGADTSKESLRATTSDATFRREAEFWTLAYKSENFRLKDSKGLQYIAHLIRNEGREVRSDEVASVGAGVDSDHLRHRAPRDVVRVASDLGDTGVILDAQAKAEYRARMTELKAELAEADGNNDVGRSERLRFEIDALERQLASALGLGGRDRKSRSHMERARWMVTNSIKRAISKIRAGDPALARHLSTRIRTGNFCSYTPDPDHPLIWRL